MATDELLPLRDLQACCAPITREAITAENADALARSLRALADPARLRLVSMMVAAHEDGEACVCDLTEPLDLSQPTVSHHLRVLTDAGFLTRSKRGTWAYSTRAGVARRHRTSPRHGLGASLRRLLAEFVGTAALVAAIIGSGIAASECCHRAIPDCNCWRTPW